MAVDGLGGTLAPVVTLLGAAVLAVPLFRRLGLGSVLGYFAAGLIVGPQVLALFGDTQNILHISELGIVLFLFLVGLEMRPQRLWALRRAIFGLGLAQVLVCTAFLTLAAWEIGFTPLVAFVAGAGFVLSSTAVIMQGLEERGESATRQGQQAVSILLFEDLAIVPLLALVAFLAPAGQGAGGGLQAAKALAAVVGLLAAGRWLLDPALALLARARAREVMTAGALLVVLGAAFVMELAGLSMAMGAFMAGVMLSGSSYRHQIEADVEPFKGILMGLFFLAVGMSLDLAAVLREGALVAALVVGFMAVKALGIVLVARLTGSGRRDAWRRAARFAQGGEFAFVLYGAALAGGLFGARESALFGAVIILSMALSPLVVIGAKRLLRAPGASAEGLERAEGLTGSVLVIGFGRFGQIVAQAMLAQGVDVSLIENDPDRIRQAGRFGAKVFYGDGTRLDVLRASGAGAARAVLVCVDDRRAANQIADLVQHEFPQAALLVRAWDRTHAIELIRAGVPRPVRETLESALVFGGAALEALGVERVLVEEIIDDIRRRDAERLSMQVSEGILAGAGLLLRNTPPEPEPLTRPRG